jgi:hypothetical protein
LAAFPNTLSASLAANNQIFDIVNMIIKLSAQNPVFSQRRILAPPCMTDKGTLQLENGQAALVQGKNTCFRLPADPLAGGLIPIDNFRRKPGAKG